jgi:hypothetical protein
MASRDNAIPANAKVASGKMPNDISQCASQKILVLPERGAQLSPRYVN